MDLAIGVDECLLIPQGLVPRWFVAGVWSFLDSPALLVLFAAARARVLLARRQGGVCKHCRRFGARENLPSSARLN